MIAIILALLYFIQIILIFLVSSEDDAYAYTMISQFHHHTLRNKHFIPIIGYYYIITWKVDKVEDNDPY